MGAVTARQAGAVWKIIDDGRNVRVRINIFKTAHNKNSLALMMVIKTFFIS